MTAMIEMTSVALIVLGLLFAFGASMGLLRFPDFYTRMHATGIGDTLMTILMLSGFALFHLREFTLVHLLVAVKILCILFFIFLTSPTSTHALIRAGYEGEGGRLPWLRPAAKKEEPGS